MQHISPQRNTRKAATAIKLLGVVFGLAVAMSACSSSSDTVTIYSGRTEELISPILADFTEETGIEVEVRYDDSANLALLITEEGDKTPADVFLSQSPGAVDFLDGEGRLIELPSDILNLVPESVRDAEGRWVGFSGRQRVMVYNPDLVDAGGLPQSVFDLTAPEWKGRLGIAPSNGSFQDFVTAMRGQVGDARTLEWLEGLAANETQTFSGNSGIVAAVGRGEVDAGLVNHYYNYRFLEEDPNHSGANHQLDTADPGSILIVTGAAIVENSDNQDSAEKLVEWLLGDSAQRYFADETFEYPLADGVAPSSVIPPAEFSAVGGLDLSDLSNGLEGTRDLINQAGFQG